jgi:hypothetical protein
MQIEHETDRRACDLAQALLCMVYQTVDASMERGVITREKINKIFGEILPCTDVGRKIIKELDDLNNSLNL